METCVFCKIARGEIPVQPVYEDEHVLAFDDMSPQAPVHVLVIPREHYEHLGDGIPAEEVASLFGVVPEVAHRAGVDQSGYRVIVNAGRDANQTVPHLHVHVLGGKPMLHEMVTFAEGERDV
ncbi:MAG: histidine triad nucleotide-binding protein [Coriobacteriia bacterium]|jgi:histidine triad (HIT) family protein|nr:histidine triad nucleotide-binding protein [Coriobacteriia bacterium]